jgi:two-component system NtrC family response regulator/two-component system response regulator HydG
MATPTVPGRVLIVDDDPDIRESLSSALDPTRYILKSAADGATAISLAEGFSPEVILLDLGLPDVQGLDLIPRFRELDEMTGIIVLTATSEIAVVVRAMRLGADNFLVKPATLETLNEVLGRTLLAKRRDRQLRALVVRTARPEESTIVGSSRPMRRVVELIAQVADTDATVLLEGESGSGKGLAAEAIHRRSGRADGPFLDMNCAGLSPTLLESELFGHEKGAFTDASRSKPGLLEIASGGTVFLDEIGEMPLEVQSKLLKVLESRRFRRVGGIRDITSNVRLIAASNHDIKSLVKEGRFREDLYYRLNVFAITIPPLRYRADDILELAHHFLGELNRSLGTRVEGFDATTTEILRRYGWPGNARELRNVVERAVILVREGMIESHHLPADLLGPAMAQAVGKIKALAEIERDHLGRALDATGGNIKRAAELLKISRTTLYNKIKAHKIRVRD